MFSNLGATHPSLMVLFCSSTLSSVRQRTPKQRSKAASHTDLQLGGTPEDLDQDGDGDSDDGTLEDGQHDAGDERYF